jgi:hypothetical protein
MIAAIYARKSTEQNLPEEEKSIARQVAHAPCSLAISSRGCSACLLRAL